MSQHIMQMLQSSARHAQSHRCCTASTGMATGTCQTKVPNCLLSLILHAANYPSEDVQQRSFLAWFICFARVFGCLPLSIFCKPERCLHAVGVGEHEAANPVHYELAWAGGMLREHLAPPGPGEARQPDLQGARPCQVPGHECCICCWQVGTHVCSLQTMPLLHTINRVWHPFRYDAL